MSSRSSFQGMLKLAWLLAGLTVLGNAVFAQPGKPREEEEEPKRVKPKVTLRVDDDPPPAQPILDLRRAAEQARHAPVRELFTSLAQPHDRVTFPATGRVDRVAPLPKFFDAKRSADDVLVLQPLDGKAPFKVRGREVARVEHYEAVALRLMEAFLAGQDDIPRLEKLREAETALREVIRFHQSARQRGIRQGTLGWDDLARALRDRLLDLRVEEFDILLQAGQIAAAQELVEQLGELHHGQPRYLNALLRLRVRQVEDGLREDKVYAYARARRLLDDLRQQFPQADQEAAVRQLRTRLRQKAEAMLKSADALPEDQQREQLRAVESIWPDLPGLQERLRKLKAYPILNVGVRHLPEYLSPATAFVDAEKLALDLLFESLVRAVPDPVTGRRYEPLLADGEPEAIPLGRQFHLVRDACWYRANPDGTVIQEPVQATDVSRTLLAYQDWPARKAEWNDLLTGAQVDGDRLTVRLMLRQGHVDPLALMSFHVLPARFVQQPNDREFARRPVGSGPYQFAGPAEAGDRRFARFLLNPTYGQRSGKSPPAFREIRFHAVQDVRTDLASLPLHVLYDPPARQIEEIRGDASLAKDFRIVHRKNRRVWFLAVNQRKASLKNENLRRAIGLAIDREGILDEAFRPRALPPGGIRTKEASQQPDRTLHRSLTGPYPAGSWACKESELLDLHRPGDARARARGLAGTTVTLQYPTDLHPGIPLACERIRAQVLKETGIELVLRGVPWRQLHEAVELQHDYELAYYCWDHADDRFWIGPLFDLDPSARMAGGRNFLGCEDAELADLCRRARDHRQFSQLQQITHLIHQHVNQKLPLIPLWQIDTCLVLRHDVVTAPAVDRLDPLRLFSQVEAWQPQAR